MKRDESGDNRTVRFIFLDLSTRNDSTLCRALNAKYYEYNSNT